MTNYQSSIERDKPYIFNTFDNAANKSHPLVAGSGASTIVSGNNPFGINFPYWTDPFTVEMWFHPHSAAGIFTVFGHDDDGIIYDADNRTLEFRMKMSTGQFAVAKLPINRKTHYVLAYFDGSSVNLVVDQNRAVDYVTDPVVTTGNLEVGGGSGRIIVDALAIYTFVLDINVAAEHYYSGINFPDLQDVYIDSSNFFPLSHNEEVTWIEQDFAPTWPGFYDQTVVDNGSLLLDVGSTGGSWMGSIIIDDSLILQGSRIDFDYTGPAPVVEVTLDGSTWTPLNSGDEIAGVPRNSALADVDPLFRVTISDAETKVLTMRATVYADLESIGKKSNSTATITRPDSSGAVLEMSTQDYTAGLKKNNDLVITTLDDQPFIQLAFWHQGSVSLGSSDTMTTNGGSGYIPDAWNFSVIKLAADAETYTLVINGRIANLTTYDDVVDPVKLYNAHFVSQSISVTDADKISYSEVQSGIRLSQNNWYVL